jgi:ABC-type molybdate transport system substrate-binding protein
MKYLLSWAAVAFVASTYCAHAQEEVTLIAPGGARAVIQRLIPEFERQTGYKVKATFGSGLGTKQQVARGEAFDVSIVQPPYPEVLASEMSWALAPLLLPA